MSDSAPVTACCSCTCTMHHALHDLLCMPRRPGAHAEVASTHVPDAAYCLAYGPCYAAPCGTAHLTLPKLVHDWKAGLQDVAEFTTTCERYVGTESGGMDQAISLMGMPMMAKLVEFNPVGCLYLQS